MKTLLKIQKKTCLLLILTIYAGVLCAQAPFNDNATGAILLNVGATCTGGGYTNTNATQSPGEPIPSCLSATASGSNTIWFKFIAPASGAVKVSSDVGGGTLGNPIMALFAATDSSNYSTFSIISCDNNNGTTNTLRSLFYTVGLTPGGTYYVAINSVAGTATGTFCLEVTELNENMLASGTASCAALQGITVDQLYTGWLSLVDNTGNLVANLRRNDGLVTGGLNFNANLTRNEGALRSAPNNQPYLDRNYHINSNNVNGSVVNVFAQFFFTETERVALGSNLADLTVARVGPNTSGCLADLNTNVTTILPQTGNGGANNARWIECSYVLDGPGTQGINFFIQGPIPLPIQLATFSGKNTGSNNELYWESNEEINFDYFELQRAADGADFYPLARVKANGNPMGSSYHFIDENPINGLNMYRLNMVDKDGRAVLSEVVSLNTKAEHAFYMDLYPNPAGDFLQIYINDKINGQAQIQIIDMTGKLIENIPLNKNRITINLQSLSTGMYLVKYKDSTHSEVKTLSKL